MELRAGPTPPSPTRARWVAEHPRDRSRAARSQALGNQAGQGIPDQALAPVRAAVPVRALAPRRPVARGPAPVPERARALRVAVAMVVSPMLSWTLAVRALR